MARSWGTKVEAAFNQSLLLAWCPEELAEERLGVAGVGKHGEGGTRYEQGAPSKLGHPVLGTPWDPTITHHHPKEKAR